ncbi:MAG: hypothetical protein ACREPC_12610, partial [Stenotrophomonas sp.]
MRGFAVPNEEQPRTAWLYQEFMTMRAEWMLLLFLSASGAAHASATRGFDVLHYDVALIPDIAGKQVAGTQAIQLRSEIAALTEVVLDSGKLKV